MNPSDQEIEQLLRSAPNPVPPPDLQRQLFAQLRLPAGPKATSTPAKIPMAQGWLRHWWPALAPAAISIACLVVLALQQMQIHDLRETIRTLSHENATQAIPAAPTPPTTNTAPRTVDFTDQDQAELNRLQIRVQQLTAEITQMEQFKRSNEALRAQLNAPPTLMPEEMAALAKAKAEAMSVQCVNNLKQFGLAVRIWAGDQNGVWPPDSLSMSNELNTPMILVCPADTNRVAASNWQSFTAANCSYEYLTPSVTNADTEPRRVLSRCPIHGHIGLCDGSVQRDVARKHPEMLLNRDGKLFMQY